MKIPIIIVDYNSIEKTISYLEEIAHVFIEWKNMTPIIVDNFLDSDAINILQDKSIEVTKQKLLIEGKNIDIYFFTLYFGKIIYYYTGENLGYAKGNNIGSYIADKLIRPKYYIFCNNDLRFVEAFSFDKIKEIFDNDKRIAVVGPKIITPAGDIQSPRKKVSAIKKLILEPWFSTWPFRRAVDIDYTNESKECYWVSGCILFVKAGAFKQINRFDSNTFMFAEEMILSERLKKHNYIMWFDNNTRIVHEHGASIKSNNVNRLSEKWAYDSLKYFYRQYIRTPKCIFWLADLNLKVYNFLKMIRNFFKEHKL